VAGLSIAGIEGFGFGVLDVLVVVVAVAQHMDAAIPNLVTWPSVDGEYPTLGVVAIDPGHEASAFRIALERADETAWSVWTRALILAWTP